MFASNTAGYSLVSSTVQNEYIKKQVLQSVCGFSLNMALFFFSPCSYLLLLLTLTWFSTSADDQDSWIKLPSSCIGQSDGYQWLKPLDGDTYPPIHQKCDGEMMVIDVSHDPKVELYFSSFTQWHYAISGMLSVH